MRKLKDSLREHTVFLCAVCSALLAIIIHILFKHIILLYHILFQKSSDTFIK